MRILIADDEKLTRDGLISSISWDKLPFDHIDQADDGINALQLARTQVPDVLLTDIRMPRMNGIELAEKIQELNPHCPIIFMSGYSDKEYLMAAIKLKAVRYVEKPFTAEDLTEALSESVSTILQTRANQKSNALFTRDASSKLAQNMTRSGYSSKNDPALDDSGLRDRIHPKTAFTTFIIKLKASLNNLTEEGTTSIINDIHRAVTRRNMSEIHFIKQDSVFVMHIFADERPAESLLLRLAQEIKELIPKDISFFISIGKTAVGAGKVFHSYNSAVILLQSSFFYEYGSILNYGNSPDPLPANYPYEFAEDFTKAIQEKELVRSRALAEAFYHSLLHNHSLLANGVKDVYYKLFMQINMVQYDLKLQTETSAADSESLLETISNCDILRELHMMLLAKIDEFAHRLQSLSQENPTIFMIRDYISRHYSDYSLSIKDISDHVHLSSSYLCTVFKTETGKTLNQYITQFRVEKAKQLLADPRNKISDISSRVGYSDGNYFGKSFKKEVGLSPSEYREKKLGR
ncbi:MAG TPA: response regulator [Clostridiales bacterium]|nr:response regulator [Clostridiales bacterium]